VLQLCFYLVEALFDTIFESRQQAIGNRGAYEIRQLAQRDQLLVAALDLRPKSGKGTYNRIRGS
jgi:hypothetical protein